MKKISFETLKGLNYRDGGLTEAEVATQRSHYGDNEIVEVVGNPWLELIRDTLKDPMIWFLLGIGAVFILVGDTSEGLILFAAILPLLSMDAILHWRTQASTASLMSQLSSTVNVLRGNQEISIDSRELVPGDLVIVETGTFLPADGIFKNCTELQVDESVLTGEAFPVQKRKAVAEPFELCSSGEILVDPLTLGFAGTRVLTGQGQLRVLFTGRGTEYGEIVQSVSSVSHERTPLQKSITRLVQGLIVAAGIFCILLAGVRIYQGHGWLDALLSAATLAIAAIPEEFPVVFTFFLGVGVYRLAKTRALVRRAVSVENIGRVTYICTDKTGTITRGHLELTHLDPVKGLADLDVLKVSLGASNPEGTDPVDLAIQEIAKQREILVPERIRIFPFTEDRKQETAFVSDGQNGVVAYMKGSPQTILSKSTLSESELQALIQRTSNWAREGHKVLACAQRKLTSEEALQTTEPFDGFEFCGLIALEDPPRPEVAGAVAYCRENGIRVLMITGDHPDTAVAIAKEVGLGGPNPIVFSAEDKPENLEEKWLSQNPEFLLSLDVVARCTPLQKLRIVNALKASGELVAVTGDGVNDVPALKAADIGIAMGERGTRSAKEVSSIVLSDDNFRTIVSAIMEGRQLFSNLRKSFEYLLLIHFPFVLTAALIPLWGYPLLYLPVHIVWLELIIHPTALFAFQEKANAEPKISKALTTFFSRADIMRIVIVGLALTAALIYGFVSGLAESSDIGHARAAAMLILTLWSAGLAAYFTRLRTWSARIITSGSILSSLILIQVPLLAKFLHIAPLHILDWIKSIAVICLFLLILFIAKKFDKE